MTPEARNAYMREYRKRMTPAQKELLKGYQAKYRAQSIETINEKARAAYRANPLSQTERGIKSANSNPQNTLLKGAKYSAKRRELEFNLTLEDIVIPEVCPYLGIPISVQRGAGVRSDAASVDRIDSTKGYIKGNIQVISKKANLMKNNATKEELISFAKYVLSKYDE